MCISNIDDFNKPAPSIILDEGERKQQEYFMDFMKPVITANLHIFCCLFPDLERFVSTDQCTIESIKTEINEEHFRKRQDDSKYRKNRCWTNSPVKKQFTCCLEALSCFFVLFFCYLPDSSLTTRQVAIVSFVI